MNEYLQAFADTLKQLVMYDTTNLDIYHTDEAAEYLIGRSNLTIACDRKSRVVLGYDLSLERLSVITLRRLLNHCSQNMDLVTAKYPTVKEQWNDAGLVELFAELPAWEADETRPLFQNLLLSTNRYYPQQSGMLERVFSQLDDVIAESKKTIIIGKLRQKTMPLPALHEEIQRFFSEKYQIPYTFVELNDDHKRGTMKSPISLKQKTIVSLSLEKAAELLAHELPDVFYNRNITK